MMRELSPIDLSDPDALLALSRRTAPAGVLSIYVGADAGADPGLRGAAIDLKNRLAELERNVTAEGPRERTMALRQGLERLDPEIRRLTSPEESGRGRALFAPLGEGEGEAIRFASRMPLATRVVLDAGAFIHPLLELLDEGRPAGVVLVSQDEARVLEWRLGELRPLERLEPEATEAPHERPGPIGSSPSERARTPKREQRQAREHEGARRFLEQVQEAAARLGDRHGWERILVSGGDRLTDPLADALSAPHGAEVVRDPRVLTQLDEASLSAALTEQLRSAYAEYEARLVRDAREAGLGPGAAALGLSEVVGALNEGRVAHLLYDPAVRYAGAVGADGRLHAGEELRAAVGGVVDEPRLTERLVERALETGARVTPVEGAAAGALAEAAGVAALLRW
ncbi:VLRF1 family aeRF1-type release factor [Miltoncostaea marina]|uniref:MSMEG_1130 family ribosome hibernation factor n=1 Tax=Miltoncostaea marina TaxID=2843215 RepID=UPI001C3C4775|nr:VLRF1 family aeRF1-type release factor [Miltoncostaea marina]